MKKITKIEYQEKNKDRVNIYLDNAFAFGIHIDIVLKYSLAKNMELEEDFIEEILKAEEESKVYNYALSILSRYAKSEKKLREKLKEKGFDTQFIESTIEKLKLQKYLDDERYSDMLISSKINASKYGKRKIKEALIEKGIDRDIIQDKIKQLSDDDELERACNLGQKKLKALKEGDKRKVSIKLWNYLVNKGFEFDTAKKAVSKLVNEIEFDKFEDF
jgi:regulatory protein